MSARPIDFINVLPLIELSDEEIEALDAHYLALGDRSYHCWFRGNLHARKRLRVGRKMVGHIFGEVWRVMASTSTEIE